MTETAAKPALRIYNTLTREKEEFVPLEAGKVRMYTCGPTVYHHQHIGNLRTYVFEDVLRRVLEFNGYQVNHVMNVTDVGHLQSDADAGDDKMMLAAKREQRSPWDIAREYEAEFLDHTSQLNIKRPTTICRATEHIPEMIDMVSVLVEQGYAYQSGGNVYFDVSKFDRYSDFARLRIENFEKTDRVEHDERKRNQADFALWFSVSKFPNQIMKWASPWGEGFPGWHIECSAMASKYLGKRIDIHCGGIDHIPVHHTNEIAQAECCHGHKWVNYWLHGEHLHDATGKMSKSKGEFLTLDSLTKDEYDALDYRYLLLTAHYRGSVTFSYESLNMARNTLKGLRETVRRLRDAAEGLPDSPSAAFYEHEASFIAAVNDDLHMPIALTVMWATTKDDRLSAAEKLALLNEYDQIFGLDLDQHVEYMLTSSQKTLLDARLEARKNKNWAESDRIRDELLAQGIALEDGPQGTTWRYVGK